MPIFLEIKENIITYFKTTFAAGGQRADIPKKSSDKNLSWDTGYTNQYTDLIKDGKYVDRKEINSLLADITQLHNEIQDGSSQYYKKGGQKDVGDLLHDKKTDYFYTAMLRSVETNESLSPISNIGSDQKIKDLMASLLSSVYGPGDLLFSVNKYQYEISPIFWQNVDDNYTDIQKIKNPILYNSLKDSNFLSSKNKEKLVLKPLNKIFFKGSDGSLGKYSEDSFPEHKHDILVEESGLHDHGWASIVRSSVRGDSENLNYPAYRPDNKRINQTSVPIKVPHTHKVPDNLQGYGVGEETRPKHIIYRCRMLIVENWGKAINEFIEEIRKKDTKITAKDLTMD